MTTAAQDARRLADVRYQGGATSYLEVLDADTRLFDAEPLSPRRAKLNCRPSLRSIERSEEGGDKKAAPRTDCARKVSSVHAVER
jgi:outer membrane protein, multidrug efflux system